MALEDTILLAELLDKSESIDQAFISFKEQRLNRIIKLAEKGRYVIGRIIRNFIIRKGDPANVVAWKKIVNGEV